MRRKTGVLIAGCMAIIGGCGQKQQASAAQDQTDVPAISLPQDGGERAAMCYAARAVQFAGDDSSVPVNQADEAAQFLFLEASTSGVTEPSKVDMLQKVAQTAIPAVRQAGQASATLSACRKAYPATAASFSGLGPDSRDTRLQCFALAFAMTQIYDQSPTIAGEGVARTRALYRSLDDRMTAELLPGGRGNPAELAGLTTRAMAVAVGQGPITQVLDACAARYGG